METLLNEKLCVNKLDTSCNRLSLGQGTQYNQIQYVSWWRTCSRLCISNELSANRVWDNLACFRLLTPLLNRSICKIQKRFLALLSCGTIALHESVYNNIHTHAMAIAIMLYWKFMLYVAYFGIVIVTFELKNMQRSAVLCSSTEHLEMKNRLCVGYLNSKKHRKHQNCLISTMSSVG